MSRATSFSLLAATCLVVVGCKQPSDVSPFGVSTTAGTPPTVYTGSVVDSIKGSGTVTVSLVSVQGLTSGTWDMSFSGKADPERYITGTVSANAFTATFSQCPATDQSIGCGGACNFSFAGSITSNSLSGTYTVAQNSSCPAQAGNITATTQGA